MQLASARENVRDETCLKQREHQHVIADVLKVPDALDVVRVESARTQHTIQKYSEPIHKVIKLHLYI